MYTYLIKRFGINIVLSVLAGVVLLGLPTMSASAQTSTYPETTAGPSLCGDAVLDYLSDGCPATSNNILSPGFVYALEADQEFRLTSAYGTTTHRFVRGWTNDQGTYFPGGFTLQHSNGTGGWTAHAPDTLHVAHAAMTQFQTTSISPADGRNHAIVQISNPPATVAEVADFLADVTVAAGATVDPQVGTTYAFVTGNSFTINGEEFRYMRGYNGSDQVRLEAKNAAGNWVSHYTWTQSQITGPMSIVDLSFRPDGSIVVIVEWLAAIPD